MGDEPMLAASGGGSGDGARRFIIDSDDTDLFDESFNGASGDGTTDEK